MTPKHCNLCGAPWKQLCDYCGRDSRSSRSKWAARSRLIGVSFVNFDFDTLEASDD